MENKTKKTEATEMHKVPLNIILYGPPGTGKTYHTINKALDIIEPNWRDKVSVTETDEKRQETLEKFNKYVEDERIVFTTFHQALGYEDFIEGIKPNLSNNASGIFYKVENGIFKKVCNNACKKAFIDTLEPQDFDELYYNLLIDIQCKINSQQKVAFPSKEGKSQTIESIDFDNKSISFTTKGNNKVLYDHIKKLYTYIIEQKIHINNLLSSKINDIIGAGSNYTQYWAVAKELITNKHKYTHRYVIIIDEINRGNVANIFGELITLIEEDKRLGNKEAMTVTLPCSKEKFGVPNNLYIIGTMNTADRSVEALDSALRRRFVFEEMMPNASLLNENVDGVNLQNFLETINKRIEVLKDREHQIGHSYLMNVTTKEQLVEVIYKNIIPLLQEYFYGDYEKIQMVLGEGFVKRETSPVQFAVDGSNNYNDDGELYSIAPRPDSNNIEQALENIKFGYKIEEQTTHKQVEE